MKNNAYLENTGSDRTALGEQANAYFMIYRDSLGNLGPLASQKPAWITLGIYSTPICNLILKLTPNLHASR